ncbi:hypothetical protein C8R44DRAFT_261791 [Mycena epipterygia]|nr:hypothetical protein C8R44DRAFT_261791 [Mycena epipterygia]
MQSTRTMQSETEDRKHRDESATSKLWAVYISEAEKYDKALVESWRSDMEGLPIFAGLFSASLTAFLIESYKTLSPDQGERAIAILVHISHQLSVSDTGSSAELPMPGVFTPSATSLACNTLWFLSLGLSLSCALVATLVEQWARDFIQKTDMRPSPVIRARIFSYLYYGLCRFKMHAVVELIPLLLHSSLILFFAGLVAFLQPISTAIMAVAAALLIVIVSFFSYLTILPILHSDCPYRTPLSGLTRHIYIWICSLRCLGFPQRRDPDDKESGPVSTVSVASETPTLVEVMTQHATDYSPERVDRDCRALVWTVKSLTDDGELEPFVEAISDVIGGNPRRTQLYEEEITVLLRHPKVRLVSRIEGLLRGCESGLLFTEARHRRQISCLKAIWAIAHLEVESKEPFHGFNFDVLKMGALSTLDPNVQPYFLSAQALARCNLACWAQKLTSNTTWDILHYRPNAIQGGLTVNHREHSDLGMALELQHLTNYASKPIHVGPALHDILPIDFEDRLVEIPNRLTTLDRIIPPSPSQMMVAYLQDASTLQFPPYELVSTGEAIIRHKLGLTEYDRWDIRSRFAAIISDPQVARLKAHPGVHHIDVIVRILVSLWQQHGPYDHDDPYDTRRQGDHGSPTFTESLLKYVGSRDDDEALITGLAGCDHGRFSSRLAAHLRMDLLRQREAFEAIWRLFAFFAHQRRDPVTSQQMIPASFDEGTVIAFRPSALPGIGQSLAALMRLLMLRALPSEQLPSMHPPGGPQSVQYDPIWDQARRETHFLILIEFIEDCASWHEPYRAADTLRHILGPAWYRGGLCIDGAIQQRFARSLAGLKDITRTYLMKVVVDSFISTHSTTAHRPCDSRDA